MIWSRESLRNLSEDDLCHQVLIPLFRAMGYQDVRSYHGGVLEQGKDIVMWKNDELQVRVNYAVVVKAQKIAGVASVVNTVAFQAQQALGSSFIDEHTQDRHEVHEVYVVTSHEITKEGEEALRNAWIGASVHRNIKKIGGDKLWEFVQRHLPSETIFASLSEANNALSAADPDFGYTAQLGPGKIQLVAFPKGGQKEPIPIAFDPKFPSTQEGREQEKAFRTFIASGRPAEIKSEFLDIKGLPRPLESIIRRSPEGVFLLGPSKSSKTLSVSLILLKDSGEEVVLFPLVEFGDNYAGAEEITLSNEQQPIPFKFKVVFFEGDRRATISFNFDAAEKKAFSLLRAAECEMALSQGGQLIFEDIETGQRFALSPAGPSTIEPPGSSFLELLRKVVWIQRQLGLDIDLPDRDFFNDDDIADVLTIEEILRNGSFWGGSPDVKAALTPEGLHNVLSKHSDGFLGRMKFVHKYSHNILGTEVDLGPVELVADDVRIDVDQLDNLKKLQVQVPEGLSPELHFKSDKGFRAKFANWPKKKVIGESGDEARPNSPDELT